MQHIDVIHHIASQKFLKGNLLPLVATDESVERLKRQITISNVLQAAMVIGFSAIGVLCVLIPMQRIENTLVAGFVSIIGVGVWYLCLRLSFLVYKSFTLDISDFCKSNEAAIKDCAVSMMQGIEREKHPVSQVELITYKQDDALGKDAFNVVVHYDRNGFKNIFSTTIGATEAAEKKVVLTVFGYETLAASDFDPNNKTDFRLHRPNAIKPQ